MKPNPTENKSLNDSRLLILSDGKPGHVNQSIAFARHLGCEYDLVPVTFKRRLYKGLSYLADMFGYYSTNLFNAERLSQRYAAVVSAGSETYYANRTLARQLGCKAIAIMLPQGYRLDFDLIVAQEHDHPPERDNILCLPVNLNYIEPQGLVTAQPGECYVALIVGGDSAHGKLDVSLLKHQVKKIFELFPEHRFWLTTSRRTPRSVEEMLRVFSFDYAVYYSEQPLNPIPDFLEHSEYVFITADSSSMISEAVSFGASCVEVLPLDSKMISKGKLGLLMNNLVKLGCLHLFDGGCEKRNLKVQFSESLKILYD